MPAPKKHLRDLYELLAMIETPQEAEKLMADLLTPQERDSLAERWQEVQMLSSGMTQREVAKKLGVSISKVTRGAQVLKFGSGGFRTFLEQMNSKRKTP